MLTMHAVREVRLLTVRAALLLASTLLVVGCGRSQTGVGAIANPSHSAAAQSGSSTATPVTSPPPGTDVTDAQLVDPRVGWALAKQGVEWTTDGGASWGLLQVPLPAAGSVAGVDFVDASHGWVAVVDIDQSGVPTLRIVRTSDGGRSWQTSVAGTLSQGEPVGNAAFDFLPSGTGVVTFDNGSHAGFSYGSLFITNDWGATWAPRKVPGFARVRLLSAIDMWFAGGSGAGGLYVSHDQGASWVPVALTAPADYSADSINYTGAQQQGPVTTRTVATVRFTSTSGTDAIGYYSTDDNGQSWSFRSSLKAPDPAVGASAAVQIVDPRDWITTFADPQGGGRVDASSDAGATWRGVTPLPGPAAALSFADPSHGWAIVSFVGCSAYKSNCFSAERLYSTSDGGSSWNPVNPS